jgi:mevalonate kinase
MVQGVRERRTSDPERYERWFDAIDRLAVSGQAALANGDLPALGRALNANHEILRDLGVSTALIDHLVAAARDAGALGAKLSGAGGGGVMLALVEPGCRAGVADALVAGGAVRVLATRLAAGT